MLATFWPLFHNFLTRFSEKTKKIEWLHKKIAVLRNCKYGSEKLVKIEHDLIKGHAISTSQQSQ